MRLHRAAILVVALLSLDGGARAAPPADTDAYIARAMQGFGVPGLSLAIVENGKTVTAKGYGVTDINSKTPLDAHSAVPIGSESKAFTSAALAILVDRKKLKWSDLVKDRLPGFQMYDPYMTAHMTVRDLLTHRSGLGLGEGDLMLFPNTNRSRADIVHALRYLKPATGFREFYAYDNVLYIVAGTLVEAVSGQSWESFVTENILKPVGMTDTHTSYDKTASNRVSLHGRNSEALQGLGVQSVLGRGEAVTLAPAGGINASATDLAKWMDVQLAHGKLPDGKQLFSAEQSEAMWTPVVVVKPEGPRRLAALKPDMQAYALGWYVEMYRGHKIVRHTGAVAGALASLYLIPEKNVGVAVTINSEDGAGMVSVIYHLLDHYLGLPPTDWTAMLQKIQAENFAKAQKTLKTPAKDDVPVTGKAALPLAAYTGIYQDPWYGNVTVREQSPGKLWITFDRTPGMEGALEPVAGDKFRTSWTDRSIEDAYMMFARDGGAIKSATMAAISPLADFSFDYQDLHLARTH